MGGKFTGRYKKRNLLASLLLIFLKGRAKYVAIALLLAAISLPFVVSSTTLNWMLQLPGVTSFLRSLGFGGIISAINPGYSAAGLQSALDKAAADSSRDYLWNKFLDSLNPTLPPADGPSSMAMVRGGDGVFGPPVLEDDKSEGGPVKGVVNAEERAAGGGGGAVNFGDMLSNAAGGGLDGDLLGRNLAGRYAGGGNYGSGPYLNRTLISKGSAAGDKRENMYDRVFTQAASKIPVPGRPQRVNARRMGKVSGFSWRNVGYRTTGVKPSGRLNSKGPMYQLAEAFSMGAAAVGTTESAPEYQAAYVGATYDGNSVNGNVITGGGGPGGTSGPSGPSGPSGSYTPIELDKDFNEILDTAEDAIEAGDKCADGSAAHSGNMTAAAKAIDDISKTLGEPPPCCFNDDKVEAWNDKQDQMKVACGDYNVNAQGLAGACMQESQPIDCGQYDANKIVPCGSELCYGAPIAAAALIVVAALLITAAAPIIIPVILIVTAVIALVAWAHIIWGKGG